MTKNEKTLRNTLIDLECTIIVLNEYIEDHLEDTDNLYRIADLRGAVAMSKTFLEDSRRTRLDLPEKGFFARLFNL